MVHTDEGVVVKSARSGETSKLVTFVGRRSGKIRLIGKGALSGGSPFRGTLEVGNLIEVVYYHKEGRTLHFLREAHVRSTLASARRSLSHLASGLALLELIDQVCYWGSPEEPVVDLFRAYLDCGNVKDPLYLYIVVAYKLLEIVGSIPDFASCAVCKGAVAGGHYHPAEGTCMCRTHSIDSPHRVRLSSKVLEHIVAIGSSSLAGASGSEVDPSVRKQLGKIMHWTYTFHVQGYHLPRALKLVRRGDVL
jgi:DNA repair protein RecO